MIKAEWTNKDSLDLQPTCNQLATTEGDLIKALPSADRPTGKWENVYFGLSDDSLRFRCNICGKLSDGRHNYCPNCGADMRGDTE